MLRKKNADQFYLVLGSKNSRMELTGFRDVGSENGAGGFLWYIVLYCIVLY